MRLPMRSPAHAMPVRRLPWFRRRPCAPRRVRSRASTRAASRCSRADGGRPAVGGSGVGAGGAAEITGEVEVPGAGRRAGADRRRRIEQQGVFADQAAGRPRDLEDDVDEGLLDAAIADQADEQAAVGALLERCARARQHRVVVDVGGAIRLGRRDADAQAGLLFRGEAGDFDLGAEHFAERRLHAEAAEAQGRCERRREAESGGGEAGQRKAPRELQFSFQGVSRNGNADPSTGPQERLGLSVEPPLPSQRPRSARRSRSSPWLMVEAASKAAAGKSRK